MDIQGAPRVRLIAQLGFIWALLLFGRLIQLQIVQHGTYRELAEAQQQKTEEVRAPRGMILDRTGQPLALSLSVPSVCVNPMRVPDIPLAANLLSRILDLDSSELLTRMQSAARNGRGFLWIKRQISEEQARRLEDLHLEWIEIRTEGVRSYPNKEMAAHILGGVDFEERGNAGIEQALNEDLEGHPGELRVSVDPRNASFQSETEEPSVPGKTLKLTIDSRIQFSAEQELEKAVKAHHAKTGSVVAMDPKTGAILALANYPTYDPNERAKKDADLDARDNIAVTTPYEPGSVFKVITISAALETTNLKPETIIPCGNGKIALFGRVIHDHNSYASLPMEDVLARSSNIGAINIGLKVGDANMYEYVRRFGFGHVTGLPLPGESAGMVRPLRRWQKSSIGSVAMGHEVSVTAIQLAQAASVIANGGFLIKPRLLADTPISEPKRVLRPETAITMRRMMEGVVIKPYGTGHKYAHIPGYTSGGKTGTAQIYNFKTHQYTHFYNASFMGFAPVANPAIVVVATLNGTNGEAGYGGPVAAPVFREVAATALRILDVPKDLPDDIPDNSKPAPDENDVSIAELGDVSLPPVSADDAAAGQPENTATTSVLDRRSFFGPLPEVPEQLDGPKVPDFQGKNVRDVIQLSASLGIPVEYAGSGIARAQSPPPGAILPLGERVRIQFAH